MNPSKRHATVVQDGGTEDTLFAGRGEMRALCRAFDWSSTPLGPTKTWSQSLRTIVSTLLASHHPIFLWWGPELVQIYNDGYRPSLGMGDRHARALGARGRDFWADIWNVIGPEVDGVMSSGEATWHEDQLIPIERNGRIENVWWTYSYSPVRDDDGKVAGVLVVVQETTRRVELLAERERLLAESERARSDAEAARQEAEAASRAKGDFLAVMSHELRTPLNAIGGYTELLDMGIHGPVTEDQRTALKRIQQSQQHLLGLINEVLNHIRIQTGVVQYYVEEVLLAPALASAEALIAPQVRAKGLSYELSDCGDGLAVLADPEKLRQVLLNLLTNAIKFTPTGGRIAIACSEQDGLVAVAVSDTGIGVEPDKLATIFEPFVQINQLRTRPNEGVGLGLAISRDLARGMKGDLKAVSVPGVGSTFQLTLPRA